MTQPQIDANAFHQFEHEGWERASDDYHRYFGSLTSQTIGPLLNAVSTGPKTNLIDIASGPGYVSAEARRRGWVPLGVDFSATMVAMARKLYPAIDFQVADAEALSFPDSQFGAAVMNFGILHLARPEAAIREAFRVLHPGGLFAFTVWAKPEEAVGFALALDAIREFGDPNVQLPAGPPFFRFSERAECTRVLENAGFEHAAIAQLPLVWKLSTSADVFEAFYKGSARTGGLLRAQPPTALRKVHEAIEKRAATYARANGRLEIPMPALVVSARKPR